MLTIKREGLTEYQTATLESMLDILGDEPEKVRYESLKALTYLDGRLEYSDETLYDQIDQIVLERVNQIKLVELYRDLLQASKVRTKNSAIQINLSDPGVTLDEDAVGRPIARIVLKLYDYPMYLEAYEWVERARMRLWAVWAGMIHDVLPEINQDKTSSGGTKGTTRLTVAWKYENGKILARRK